MGALGRLGARICRLGGRPEERVPDDRFHAGASAPAGGDGPQKGGSDKALGRTRGGLTTKIHLLVNELGLPLEFRLTAGQVSDYAVAIELLGKRRAEAVIADKGYDSDQIVDHVEQKMKAEAVIPPRSNRKQQRKYDKDLYKQRSRIECCIGKLKHFRRFATRYEKSKATFQAMVALACSWIALKLIVDTA
jgi:transposase